MVVSRSAGGVRRLLGYAVLPVCAGALALGTAPQQADATSTTTPADAVATADADDAAATSGPPRTPAEARPRLDPIAAPLGLVADGAPVDPARLEERLSEELASDWLGPTNRRAITVRDALTGDHLLDVNADRAVTPASTTKLLSAAAIVTGLDPSTTFTTRVVQGETPQEVVIVAGGDMLLADGKGDPEKVAGHAGLGDLAAQTAAALEAAGTEGAVTVRLDLSYVPGPTVQDSWTDAWVAGGYTGRIVQLGREVDRALPYYPSPSSPEQQVAQVFRAALAKEGLKVKGGGDAKAKVVTAPAEAVELASVESAPLRDVLALALATSDNAMVEQLARQAAAAAGEETDRRSVAAWTEQVVAEDYGIDTTDVKLADASGLSDGTRIPVRVVADVLAAGAGGEHPALQEVFASRGLPIAGYTGTLDTRFHLPVHQDAVGNARAKTGSLPGVTSLAGVVTTADGRLLVFAMTADKIGDGSPTLEARSVLDEIVAELARCGC